MSNVFTQMVSSHTNLLEQEENANIRERFRTDQHTCRDVT